MKYLKFLPFLSLMVMFMFSHHQVSAQKHLDVPEAYAKVKAEITALESQIGNSNNKGKKAFASNANSSSNQTLNVLKIKYGNSLLFLLNSGKDVQESLKLSSISTIESAVFKVEEIEEVETFFDKLLTI